MRGFRSVVFRVDFVLHRDEVAALDLRGLTPQPTWGTSQPSPGTSAFLLEQSILVGGIVARMFPIPHARHLDV